MKYVFILLLLCSCAQSIREYQLQSPQYVQEGIATDIALLQKNQELVDAYFQALQEEVCKMDSLFLTGYLKPHYEQKFGITFTDDFCKIKK